MGIKKLWDLLKPVGQPIDLESLRGKTLAVDISFWLHHAKYVSELKGISEHRATVELIYRRVLKLLHFGIRPIFVFDGPESSSYKLPTLRERKKQREHQTEEKAKRSQNRTLKTLARKALAVQLARDEGKRRKNLDPQNDRAKAEESQDIPATSTSTEEVVTLSSDDDQEDEIDDSVPQFLSQCSSNSEDFQSKSVSIVFSGGDHAHVLIRSDQQQSSNTEAAGRGGFVDHRERRREALERIRLIAAMDDVKNLRQNQQNRGSVFPTRLQTYEDERLISSSDEEEFEEVPDVPVFSPVRMESVEEDIDNRADSVDAVEEVASTAIVASKDDSNTKRHIVERWDDRREENGQANGAVNGSEIVERCRELLTYFGVPYVDSPAEAEAQCVYLEKCGKTDGTITDDSDAWAFGGRIVYRHVFDRKKSALEYGAQDIFETFGLGQLHFVALAAILGCDFTPGIINVGVVAALEIISTFVNAGSGKNLDEKGLIEKLAKFRRWWEKHHVDEGKPEAPETNATKRRLRKMNCIFPPSFPDRRVFELFTKPKVKEITRNGISPFQWSLPDADNLRRLLAQELPDIRQVEKELADLKRRLTPPDPSQMKLIAYFSNAKRRPSSSDILESSSKRLKKACEKLKITH